MNIGNKIKELRKQRGITQEELAHSIGISFQAVSKWENGIALPDITLVPIIASYFGVSMDELFEFNLKEIEAAVDTVVNEAYKFRETDPPKSRAILEEGLKKYPDNEVLLNNLLYVLNYSKNPDETISIASSLIEKTNQADIKYDALRFLATTLINAEMMSNTSHDIFIIVRKLFLACLTLSPILAESKKDRSIREVLSIITASM